jgi:hypothetical protein
VQELLRIARLADRRQIQDELDVYNRFLPSRNQLQAALVIDITNEARLVEELAPWRTLTGDALKLRIGDHRLPARLVTCRPEDGTIGAAHWVQFHLDPPGRELLADFSFLSRFEIDHASYRHASLPLSEDLRQSLLDDLAMSDRDSVWI